MAASYEQPWLRSAAPEVEEVTQEVVQSYRLRAKTASETLKVKPRDCHNGKYLIMVFS